MIVYLFEHQTEQVSIPFPNNVPSSRLINSEIGYRQLSVKIYKVGILYGNHLNNMCLLAPLL